MLPILRTLALASLLALPSALFQAPGFASDATTPAMDEIFYSIIWRPGPIVGDLDGVAQITVPSGLLFTGPEGAKKFITILYVPSSGKPLGVIMPAEDDSLEGWYAVLRFVRVGYVKDTDRDKLDPDAFLKAIRDRNAAANEERETWDAPSSEILGWERLPSYDRRTKNLTWAVRARMLGREGYVAADFILRSDDPSSFIATFDSLMAGFHYELDRGYGWLQQRDRIAPYGLTGLVAGGAPGKPGLLARYFEVFIALFLAGVFFLNNRMGALGRQTPDAS
jgi:uncharacterized membrane-anchored protein